MINYVIKLANFQPRKLKSMLIRKQIDHLTLPNKKRSKEKWKKKSGG